MEALGRGGNSTRTPGAGCRGHSTRRAAAAAEARAWVGSGCLRSSSTTRGRAAFSNNKSSNRSGPPRASNCQGEDRWREILTHPRRHHNKASTGALPVSINSNPSNRRRSSQRWGGERGGEGRLCTGTGGWWSTAMRRTCRA